MEWNPILVREMRARFRHWGAFALLFGYAALLAGAMGWRYGDAIVIAAARKTPDLRLSAIGHELFLTLIWMQALAWVLIAPAITASSIAREREDGLLEGVLLAPLSPLKILAGKLLSALSFIALLILVSLPIEAVCFLMGGVSPEEFRAALALHATTALTGATIGLACSAWSRRANIALRSAYVLAIGWMIGSALALGATSIPASASGMNAVTRAVGALFAWSNPVLAAIAIATPDSTNRFTIPSSLFSDAPWAISICFQLALCVVMLWLSTLALHHPFEARDESKLNRLQAPAALPQSLSTPATPTQHSQPDTRNPDWFEIPGTSQLRFPNPVMQREARGKFRMKPPPLWALIFEVLLGLVVAYYYLLTLWAALFQRNSRETIWWVISFVALFVIAVSSAVMGAGAFSREREGRTWEALRLCLLHPTQIINAKLGAIGLAFAVYSVPFWPLLLPCLLPALKGSGDFGYNSHGISIPKALATFFILTATAFCYALWGMCWSWRSKRTVAAVGWTLGSLLFILAFVPMFMAVSFFRNGSDWLWVCHPFVALAWAANNENLPLSFTCAIALFFIGGALWLRLLNELSRAGVDQADKRG